jgi:hypothetical protein
LLSVAAHETAIVNQINSAPTGGAGTPHQAAVKGLCTKTTSWATANPTHKTVGVYISDGDYPADCGGTQAQIASVCGTAYSTKAVKTFTVGLPGADMPLLNTIASAGGTTAFNLTGSSNVAADLTAALTSIQSSVMSCAVTIPNASQVNPADIDVVYKAGGIPPGTTLTKVLNASACTNGATFYLDNNTSPTKVILCPAICSTVQADSAAIVDITGGCIGGYVAASYSEQYHADCSGYEGSGAFWDYFWYDNTIPGDATVIFNARTAHTQAELATATYQLIATATSASPDVAGGSPISLVNALGDDDSMREWLELEIIINPTSNGLATPTVNGWNFSFSCLPNE